MAGGGTAAVSYTHLQMDENTFEVSGDFRVNDLAEAVHQNGLAIETDSNSVGGWAIEIDVYKRQVYSSPMETTSNPMPSSAMMRHISLQQNALLA